MSWFRNHFPALDSIPIHVTTYCRNGRPKGNISGSEKWSVKYGNMLYIGKEFLHRLPDPGRCGFVGKKLVQRRLGSSRTCRGEKWSVKYHNMLYLGERCVCELVYVDPEAFWSAHKAALKASAKAGN